MLEQLRRIGVAIAIDDCGAKYSSLDYLRTNHVRRLKIARGMVAAADAEPSARAQGQGFYYSRAVSAAETMQMLRSDRVAPEEH